jgi:hypothetical protein
MTDTDYPYDTAEAVRRAKMADQDAHHLKRLEGKSYNYRPGAMRAVFIRTRPLADSYLLMEYKRGMK